MQRPNVIHVPISPTAGSAHSKSPSQVLRHEAEADGAQELVQRARRVVDPVKACATTTVAIVCGMNSTVRKKVKPRTLKRVRSAVRKRPITIEKTA